MNQQKKQDKKDKSEESDKKNNNKEDKNINEEEDEIIMEQEEDSSEQNIRSISRRSIENEEEEEINEMEEEYEEDELNQENILEENNVAEEEDLFSLMHSEENEEEDEDSNELLNNSENPLDLNNINMRIIQNENDNDLDGNSSLNNSERFIINDNDYYNEDNNNYNEENVLFFEPYTAFNPDSKSKMEFLNFYEEFIVFPFLVLRAKSKNNLIYFSRPKINIDIFSNIGKEIVNKSKSMFLYYYLFPFDLNYNKYFDFCLIGLKDKTIKSYNNEIEKILNEFLSMYSINNVQKIKEICAEIANKLKEDCSIIQIKKEETNNNKINDKEKNDEHQKSEEKNKNNLDNKKDKDDFNEKSKNEEEESKSKPDNNNDNNINTNNNEQNNNSDNLQFILELPQDLREEILRDLDPNIVPNLSPELRKEYDRIMNRNELFPLLNLNYILQFNQGQTQSLDKYYELRRLKYKKKNILNILTDENNLNKNDEENLVKLFDHEFLENMILYDIKVILMFKRKIKKKFNDYGSFMNILIENEILQYKILDILLNLWICDSSYLIKLIKEEKINQKNNSFLDKLYYIYIKLSLTEDYFFEDFEYFFINFATKYQKYCKKYFLQTFFDENGEYIIDNKIFNITENSKQLKKLINIEYKINENVLNNLINITLVDNNSNLKTIFSLKIFTVIIQNCIKNKGRNVELNISKETLEKILDLFNNFEVTLVLNKGQRSNNPTILIKELINDQKIFKIILGILPTRFKLLKDKIIKEMEDFLTNKK